MEYRRISVPLTVAKNGRESFPQQISWLSEKVKLQQLTGQPDRPGTHGHLVGPDQGAIDLGNIKMQFSGIRGVGEMYKQTFPHPLNAGP